MKKIFMLIGMIFILFACGGPGYEKNTQAATINTLKWDEVMKRIDNDETLMFMVTFEGCTSCEYFKENVLNKYIENHGFELNIVNFTKDAWNELSEEVANFVKENPYTQEEFERAKYYEYTDEDKEIGTLLTPSLYFVENGEVKDKLISGGISAVDLDSMISKYRLDKVK